MITSLGEVPQLRRHAPAHRIATPSENAWSETFIAAHLNRLQGVQLVLSGGELPTRVVNGPSLQRYGLPAQLLDHALARLLGTDRSGLLSRRIARLLRQERIQVLLAEYGSTAHVLLDACRRADVPLVAHFHGFDAHKEAVIEAKGRYQALFAQAGPRGGGGEPCHGAAAAGAGRAPGEGHLQLLRHRCGALRGR